jgi:hypothetical protein
MTPLNMAKHRNSPHMAFWRNIKEGHDYFETTGLEPKVSVCEKRYVFNAEQPANASRPLLFNPAGRCPAFEVQPDIAMAFAEKSQRDEQEFSEWVKRRVPTVPVKTGRDGGMHPTFLAKLNAQQREANGSSDRLIEPINARALGTNVNPPRDAEPATQIMVAEVPLPRPAPLRKHGAVASAPQALPGGAGLASLTNGFVDKVMSARPDALIDRATSTVSRWIGFGDDDRRVPARSRQAAAARPAAPVSARAEPSASSASAVSASAASPPSAIPSAAPLPQRRPHAPAEALARPAEMRASPAQLGLRSTPPQGADAPPPQPAATGSVPNVMAGAQPVMQTDSFDSRFGALR